MRTESTSLTLSLLLVTSAFAQTGDKQHENPKDSKGKSAAAQERPKDDPLTAKDTAIVAIDKFIKTKGPAKKQADWRTTLVQPPQLTFDKAVQYEWHLKTNKGQITIRLMHDIAPMHVSSTIYLARLGFYDGLAFHRVISKFMAQGGCPLGNGTGNPGYKFAGEFDESVKHDKPGLLSMANAGPNTDGSQFFLTFVPTPHLNGKHTIFGEVISGMDVVEALEACGSASGRPSEALSIEQSWIVVTPSGSRPAEGAPKVEPAKDPKAPKAQTGKEPEKKLPPGK